jgi:WD40 repeat protein
VVKLCDIDSKQASVTLRCSDRSIYTMDFSPDGKILALGGQDRRVRLWDLKASRELPAPPEHSLPICQARFSPDGRTLVLATGDWDRYQQPGEVTFWDVATTAPRGIVWQFKGRVTSLAMAPDGKTVAAGCSSGIRLCDVARASIVASLLHDDGQVTALLYSPDGRWLAAGYNRGDIVVWDTATHHRRAILKGHSGVISALAFAHDNHTLISGGSDKTVKFWNLDAPPPPPSPAANSAVEINIGPNPPLPRTQR